MSLTQSSPTKNLLKFLFFIIYTLVILEVVIRIALAIDPIFIRILDFDSVSERMRWVRRHQESDVEILYKFDLYDSTKGWITRPNLTNETVFNDKTLNTNAKGLRGSKDYPYEKPADKTRILILGDSFTFGDEVSDDETYAHYLQELLPETEVINFGMHGYGHDQMLIYFQEEGKKYQPDIVILGFIHHDMYRNTMHFKDYAKPKFELENDQLQLTNVPVPKPEEILNQDFYRLKTFDLFAILYHKISWRTGTAEEKMEQLTAAILDKLVQEIEDIGAIPVFAYLPEERNEQMPPEEEFFTEYCQQREEIVYCSTLRPYFWQNLDPEANYKEFGGHWNALGHQIIAQGLLEYLEAEILPETPTP